MAEMGRYDTAVEIDWVDKRVTFQEKSLLPNVVPCEDVPAGSKLDCWSPYELVSFSELVYSDGQQAMGEERGWYLQTAMHRHTLKYES